MKFFIFFKHSTAPDHRCATLSEARKYMIDTGVIVITESHFTAAGVEMVWYNKGVRK